MTHTGGASVAEASMVYFGLKLTSVILFAGLRFLQLSLARESNRQHKHGDR